MGSQTRFTVFAAVIGLIVVSCVTGATSDLVNQDVERVVNLQTQVANTALKITVKNTGSSSANQYYINTRSSNGARIAFVGASQGETPVAVDKEKDGVYRVDLAQPIAAGKTSDITVRIVETHVAKPFPTQIGQAEAQSMRTTGNHYFYSPYKTESQTTDVILPSASIHSQTELEPTQVKQETITYGPYKNVPAKSVSETTIHYEAAVPFLTATTLVKEIEVSHWGNVAVEEHYTIQHEGAALKTGFSRYDFQRNPSGASGVVKMIPGELPKFAAEGYYRDVIGNVSTSRWREEDDGSVTFEMTPRFPLYGGWKTQFYFGYNLPTPEYLKVSSETGEMVLDMTFGTPFKDVVVDDFELRVILPEGSKNVRGLFPFLVSSQEMTVRKTYLDVAGRPVLVVKVNNVVDAHRVAFQVRYNFGTISMLNEPLLVIIAFFAFFAACMAYTRLELTLKHESPSAGKVLAVLGPLAARQDRRSEIYAHLESGDISRADATSEVEGINNAFASGLSALDNLDSGLAGKVKDLVRLEKERHRAYLNYAELKAKAGPEEGINRALQVARSVGADVQAVYDQHITPLLE